VCRVCVCCQAACACARKREEREVREEQGIYIHIYNRYIDIDNIDVCNRTGGARSDMRRRDPGWADLSRP
jgi:hypothetical protein